MTLEQLRIFVAVAERLHMTRAAEALHLTQSAVSAAVQALETRHGTRLFDRVGRGLALNAAGTAFLPEARAVLARAEAAERLLDELAGLKRGSVRLFASQTIAAYWLPPRMAAFAQSHPGVELHLSIGNTHRVVEAVLAGEAELGLIEGAEDAPRLERIRIGADRLIVVAAPDHPLAGREAALRAADLKALDWALREPGSGTRSEFEAALPRGIAAFDLKTALVLPSNEAILTAVAAGGGAGGGLVTAISELAARPLIEAGRLVRLPLDLPERPFYRLRHRERGASRAAEAFAAAL
ncbi:LysR family transcriptional regulator [Brevundimonas naejangsanensis]|uniref:LysR family transcriptional regulator n=1 Tax=Brevundimonas naejangsanensis TaxID=588932 RepID=UPI0004627D48|nr:LysR substrate-binding domain-containing protein [Brevundimonas naejangsanensis]